MSEPKSSWSFVGISPEARQAAEEAADVSGMELNAWLTQLIKYTSAMELREGRRPASLDELIRRETAPGGRAAPSFQRVEPAPSGRTPPAERTFPGVNPMAAGTTKADSDERTAETGPETGPKTGPETGAERGAKSSSTLRTGEVLDTGPGSTGRILPAGRAGRGPDGARRDRDGDRRADEEGPTLATDTLRPSRLSALTEADENAIRDALDEWRDTGGFRPLTVRPRAGEPGLYEVVVGIARWHAARRAHVRDLPVILREMSDEEALTHGLAARLREGPVSALAEASIYLRLMTEAAQSTEQVARLVGKPPAHVATMVRILNLPKAVREMLDDGEITILHARALLDAPNPEAIARDVGRRRLDIYQTEQLVRIASRNAQLVEPEDLDRDDHAGSAGPGVTDPGIPGDRGAYYPEHESAGRGRAAGLLPDRPRPERASPERGIPDLDHLDPEPSRGRAAWTGAERSPSGRGHVAPHHAPYHEHDEDDDPASLRIPQPRARGRAERAGPGRGAPAPSDTGNGYGGDFSVEPPAPPRREAGPRTPVFPNDMRSGTDAGPDAVITPDLLERHLARLLGLKVSISEHGGIGLVTLHYSSREQLSDLIARLNSASNV